MKPYRKAAIFYFGHFLFLLTGRKFSWVQYPTSYSGSKSNVKGGSVFVTTTVDNRKRISPTASQRTVLDSTTIGRNLELHANPSYPVILGKTGEPQQDSIYSTIYRTENINPTTTQNLPEPEVNHIHSVPFQRTRQDSTVSGRARLDSIVIGKFNESEINSISPIVNNRLRLHSTVIEEPEEVEPMSIYSSVTIKAISRFRSAKINNITPVP